MSRSAVRGRIATVILLGGILPSLTSLAAHLVLGDAVAVQEPLHEGVELVGSCIALGVAMLLWLRLRHESASSHLVWVMASLVLMGLVDCLHALEGVSITSWQRHGATFAGGLLFGLVWLRPLPAVTRRIGRFLLVVVGLALVLGMWWASDWMPATWDLAGSYRLPVIAANMLGGIGFLTAALFFIRRYLRTQQTEDLVFANHTVLFGVSSLFFGFSHAWAADWWVTHGVRLLAYSVLLVAAYDVVVKLYERTAGDAQELQRCVDGRTVELATANSALRESVERFELANQATFNVIWDWDLKTDALYWNERMHTLFGYRPEEIEPGIESWTNRIHPEDLESVRTGIHEAIDSGRDHWSDHYRFRRKDGTYADVDDRGYIARDANGQPTRMIGAMQDITDRRLAQDALRDSQVLLDETERMGKVGGWEFDMDTQRQTWTKAVYDIHEVDLTYEPTVGSGISFYTRASQPVINHAVQRVLEAGEPFDVELEIITAKGNLRSVHAIGRADPARRKVLGFFQDITERKRAEEEVRTVNAELDQRVKDRTAQLAAANRELEAFSYSVSHDLRAPLRAIDGFGRILSEDYEHRLDAEGQRLIGIISSETRRMGRLIDDLLTFSRMGRQEMAPSRVDMTALARSVFEEQEAQAPGRTLKLELKPLPSTRGDPAMMRIALGNLLSNAIKFTRRRDLAVIEIGTRQEDGQTVYYVKDNGVGFDMTYAHKLFGVFQRLHSPEEFEGTGVGLAMAQRIIHRHGGRIWAEGKVDEGAVFSFSSPGMKEE
jgi:PAS domain S-box-containing protein